MVIAPAEIAGGAAVVAVVGGLTVRAVVGGREDRPEVTDVPRANPSWRLLETEEELGQAVERAIAYERASVALAEQRAEHFAAMRRKIDPRPVGAPLPPKPPGSRPLKPRESRRTNQPRVPRAS